MISEALELREEDGRVNHSWWMGVGSDSYGGFNWGRGGGGSWQTCRTTPAGFVACREIPEHYPSAR